MSSLAPPYLAKKTTAATTRSPLNARATPWTPAAKTKEGLPTSATISSSEALRPPPSRQSPLPAFDARARSDNDGAQLLGSPANSEAALHQATGSIPDQDNNNNDKNETTDTASSSPIQAAFSICQGAGRFEKHEHAILRGVFNEMKEFHPAAGLPLHVDTSMAISSDNAATVKKALLDLWEGHSTCPQVADAPCRANLLWNRVRVQRMRFQGSKEWYVVVMAADNVRRLLVLHRPPRHQTRDEASTHALRQVTYRDNIDGVFEPGRRVKWEEFEQGHPWADAHLPWCAQTREARQHAHQSTQWREKVPRIR